MYSVSYRYIRPCTTPHYTSLLADCLCLSIAPSLPVLASHRIAGRGSSLYQVAGAFIILLGAWVVLLPSSASDGDGSGGDSSLVFVSNLLYMASNIPIALR